MLGQHGFEQLDVLDQHRRAGGEGGGRGQAGDRLRNRSCARCSAWTSSDEAPPGRFPSASRRRRARAMATPMIGGKQALLTILARWPAPGGRAARSSCRKSRTPACAASNGFLPAAAHHRQRAGLGAGRAAADRCVDQADAARIALRFERIDGFRAGSSNGWRSGCPAASPGSAAGRSRKRRRR